MTQPTCSRCGEPLEESTPACPNCGAARTAGATPAPEEGRSIRRSPSMAPAVTVVCLALAALAAWFYFNREPSGGAPSTKPPPRPDFAETKRKAESGDAQAALLLGDCLADGRQVRQNYKQAAEWYRKAADQGVAQAQYKLGVLYDIGQGVTKDETEAAKWYRRAAEQGNSDAQYTLAGMYGLGRGVTRDAKESLRWYERAAEQGEALACYNLAERYERGRDVSPDPVEAFKWHSLAAERGLPDGATAQDSLKKILTSAQLAEARQRIREFNAKHPVKGER